MHQIELKLPNSTPHDYVSDRDEAPPALNRGVVFLALVVLGWTGVWVTVRLVLNLMGGAGH